jgi:hypothetical protein
MEGEHRDSADEARRLIEQGLHDPAPFRAALLRVPPLEQDGWLDRVVGIDSLPDDGPDLPRGCVPYIPCSAEALMRVVDQVAVAPTDVFVDLGSGLGRAVMFVHLLTGAEGIGVEIQSHLALGACGLAERLGLGRVSFIQGDAARNIEKVERGSIFFLYCPFGGERLVKVLADLERIARKRVIRVCSLDITLPACPWLTLETQVSKDLKVFHSTLS